MKKILSILILTVALVATNTKTMDIKEEIIPQYPKFKTLEYKGSYLAATLRDGIGYVIDRESPEVYEYTRFGKFSPHLKTIKFGKFTEDNRIRPKTFFPTEIKELGKKEIQNIIVPEFPRFNIAKGTESRDKAIAFTIKNSTGYRIKGQEWPGFGLIFSYSKFWLPEKEEYTLSDFIEKRARVRDQRNPKTLISRDIQKASEKAIKEYLKK